MIVPTTTPNISADSAAHAWHQTLDGYSHRCPNQSTGMINLDHLHANEPWGDSFKPKEINATRIYCINTYGTPLDSQGGKFADLCRVALETQSDITLFSKHQLDTTRYQVSHICQEICKDMMVTPVLTMASSDTESTSYWKPGGTGILSKSLITSRIKHCSTDPWAGRLSTHLMAKMANLLLLFCAINHVKKIGPLLETSLLQHNKLVCYAKMENQTPAQGKLSAVCSSTTC